MSSATDWFSKNRECINSLLNSTRSSKDESTYAMTRISLVWQWQIMRLAVRPLTWFFLAKILNSIQISSNGWFTYSFLMKHSYKCIASFLRQYINRTERTHSTIKSDWKCSLDSLLILTKSTTSWTHGSSTTSGTAITGRVASPCLRHLMIWKSPHTSYKTSVSTLTTWSSSWKET